MSIEESKEYLMPLVTRPDPLPTGARSQSTQSPAVAPSQELDDAPPIQNTLDTQPADKEEEAGGRAMPGSAPAPAGVASNTPQLPQQSLVAKLNDAAETEPVATKAVNAEDASIAFVTMPGLAEGIQTSADAADDAAAGKAGSPGTMGTAGTSESNAKAAGGSKAADDSPAVQPPARTRTSRAAKAAATARLSNAAALRSSGKKAAEKKSASGGNVSEKEIAESAPAEEASHMAEKEPHSRVDEVRGVRVPSSKSGSANAEKQQSGADKRDPLIGRCVKKDFETDNGTQTYTGWIIGKHETKKWYVAARIFQKACLGLRKRCIHRAKIIAECSVR